MEVPGATERQEAATTILVFALLLVAFSAVIVLLQTPWSSVSGTRQQRVHRAKASDPVVALALAVSNDGNSSPPPSMSRSRSRSMLSQEPHSPAYTMLEEHLDAGYTPSLCARVRSDGRLQRLSSGGLAALAITTSNWSDLDYAPVSPRSRGLVHSAPLPKPAPPGAPRSPLRAVSNPSRGC